MRERDISIDEVKQAIELGEIIEDYPSDRPFPSKLAMCCTTKLIHVVYAEDGNEVIVITAYRPSYDKWENDLRTRKKV